MIGAEGNLVGLMPSRAASLIRYWKVVREIFRILAEINRSGVTILLVEQNAHMSLEIASRGYVMESGRIILTGTGRELSKDPRVIEAYLGG